MKFLKKKRYSILLNIFRYSFLGIFAIALILPTIFVSDFTKIVKAAGNPQITSFAPTSGKVGDMVVINGQNLGDAQEVIFNNISTTPTIINSGKITANVPVGATTGKITVSILLPDATYINAISSNDFTVTPAANPSMSVSNITDTTAQLNGQNFEQGNYKIYFVRSDGISGGNINANTDLGINGNFTQQVTALLPCLSYTITARKDSLTGTILTSADFKTIAQTGQTCSANSPKITSITPTTGKVGDTVTIIGENLVGNTKVVFNTTNAVPVTNTANKITVTVPPGATDGKIKITTNNGSVLSSNNFTISGSTSGDDGDGDSNDGAGNGPGTNGGIVFKKGSLVPVCNTGEIDPVTGNYKNPCDFNMVMALVNKFINFLLITLATPLFALIIIYVAWLYLSDMGSSENIKKAKKIFKNAFIGYIIALAAWLIIKTILVSVGFDPKQAFLEV